MLCDVCLQEKIGDPRVTGAKVRTYTVKGKSVKGILVQHGEEGIYEVKRGSRTIAENEQVVDDGTCVVDDEQQGECFAEAHAEMDSLTGGRQWLARCY